MRNNLQIYDNDTFGKIRGMMIDGKPYFVGKDVASALGYKDVTHAILDHVDEEDRINSKTQGQNAPKLGQRGGWLINESGLYSLILSSKLPDAKKFKRWITNEVIPSIRETGTYAADKNYQRWMEMRQKSKEVRKLETNIIKLFIDYARTQGCTFEDGYFYGILSVKANIFVGLPKRNGRDKASVEQLSILGVAENGIKQILIKGMADGLHYSRIIAQVDVWLGRFRLENFIDSYLDTNTPQLRLV